MALAQIKVGYNTWPGTANKTSESAYSNETYFGWNGNLSCVLEVRGSKNRPQHYLSRNRSLTEPLPAYGRRHNVFAAVPRKQAERFGVRIPVGASDFFHKMSRSDLGPLQSPIQWVRLLHSGGKAAETWQWPLTCNLAPRIRMSEGIPQLPVDDFMTWTGKLDIFKFTPSLF